MSSCSHVFAMCMYALLEKVSLVKVALCTWYQQSLFLQNSVSLLQREEFPSSGSLTVTIYVFGLLQRKRPR